MQESLWRIMFKLPGNLREDMMFHMKLQHSLAERMLRDLNLDKNTELHKENDELKKENAKLRKENKKLQKFRRKETDNWNHLEYKRDRLRLSKDATREQIEKADRKYHWQRKCEIAECKERKRAAKNQWRAERAIATANGVEFETWKERATKLGIENWLSKPAKRLDLRARWGGRDYSWLPVEP